MDTHCPACGYPLKFCWPKMVLNDREKSAIKPKLNYLLMPEFMLKYQSYAKKDTHHP